MQEGISASPNKCDKDDQDDDDGAGVSTHTNLKYTKSASITIMTRKSGVFSPNFSIILSTVFPNIILPIQLEIPIAEVIQIALSTSIPNSTVRSLQEDFYH